MRVALVGTAPKPRLVELQIAKRGEEPFELAGSIRRATHFVVHVDLGGVAGVVASLVGKQPDDTHVWILEGEAPTFVKSEGALYVGGPSWRIELASPAAPPRRRRRARPLCTNCE